MSTDGRGTTYRLVLGGELGDRFVMLFEGMHMSQEGGNTVLSGPVTDQAHLAGIIERAQELGLDLISVSSVGQASKDAAGSSGIAPAP